MKILIYFQDVLDQGHYIIVQMMSFPHTEVGQIVVIVGYDSVRGFEIKSSDEENGKVVWIPFDRMTWFQCFATEEIMKGVRFTPTTWDSASNRMVFGRTDRPRVI